MSKCIQVVIMLRMGCNVFIMVLNYKLILNSILRVKASRKRSYHPYFSQLWPWVGLSINNRERPLATINAYISAVLSFDHGFDARRNSKDVGTLNVIAVQAHRAPM